MVNNWVYTEYRLIVPDHRWQQFEHYLEYLHDKGTLLSALDCSLVSIRHSAISIQFLSSVSFVCKPYQLFSDWDSLTTSLISQDITYKEFIDRVEEIIIAEEVGTIH